MDDLELIAALGGAVPHSDAAARAAAAGKLDARIARGPRRRARRVVPIALAATVAVAIAGVVAHRVLTDEPSRPATDMPSNGLRPLTGRIPAGRVWYRRTEGSDLVMAADQFAYAAFGSRELWVGADGAGRDLGIRRGTRFITPADRRAWTDRGRPDLGGAGRTDVRIGRGGDPAAGDPLAFAIGQTELTYDEMLALPDDPDVLALRIADEARRCGCGQSVEQQQFAYVQDFLIQPAIPARLRLGFLGAARRLPQIEPVDRTTDAIGRPGIAISRVEPYGIRNTLIFDAETGTLLGDRSETARASDVTGSGIVVPAGTMLADTAYVAEGIVDSLDERVP